MAYANREKKRAYQREWARRKRLENADAVRKYRRRYYAINRGRIREQERLRHAANPVGPRAIARTTAAARRALKANAPQGSPADAAAYAEILRDGICELCGATGPIHIDHIEPLSKGGEHGWENFAGLCKSCNSSKGTESLLLSLLDM